MLRLATDALTYVFSASDKVGKSHIRFGNSDHQRASGTGHKDAKHPSISIKAPVAICDPDRSHAALQGGMNPCMSQ